MAYVQGNTQCTLEWIDCINDGDYEDSVCTDRRQSCSIASLGQSSVCSDGGCITTFVDCYLGCETNACGRACNGDFTICAAWQDRGCELVCEERMDVCWETNNNYEGVIDCTEGRNDCYLTCYE